MGDPLTPQAKLPTRAQELRAFLLLSVVMAPVLAVAVVSGYGFLVWMVQLVAGPPGTTF
jgi:periplasmic nitrate reductase NapE